MKRLNIISGIILVTGIILFFSNPGFAQEEEKNNDKDKEWHSKEMKGMKIEKMGDDSVVVYINKKSWDDFPMHHMPFCCKKGKYNGHWAGVELGWNGYVNEDFNMTYPANEQYLNLNNARSLMVNLNPFEFNFNLVRNHFGITSGLGFSLNNYYFSNSTLLIKDSMKLVAYNIVDQNGKPADMKVNKLFISWLTVPVLFEYQTNSRMRMNSFHVSLGVIGGVRLCSYTKQEYYARNTDYFLKDDNGKTIGMFNSGEKPFRDKGQYHLNTFKADLTARIGWSFLNLWTTYSLTPMYQKDQGPVLHPWTVGITLVGW
jgi:hypothetical protein